MIPKREVNIACRISWETWKQLDDIRAVKATQYQKTSLSDIIREALENYVGDTWQPTKNH